MTDTFTTNVTAAAYYAQAGAMGSNRPSLADEQVNDSTPSELSTMTRCPNRCGARFHGKSEAFHRHVADPAACGSVWG